MGGRIIRRSVGGLAACLVPLSGVSVANAAEGGLPQLTQTDTFVSQIFWLVVSFAILYLALNRVFLPRLHQAISEREAGIQGNLTHAEKLHREAVERQEAYEQVLAEAKGSAREKLDAIAEAAQKNEAEMRTKLDAELEARLQASQAQLKQARQQAETQLAPLAAEFASQIALRFGGVKPEPKAVEQAVAQALSLEGAGGRA
jgi:F-type H+-transporting ATPase subunit b